MLADKLIEGLQSVYDSIYGVGSFKVEDILVRPTPDGAFLDVYVEQKQKIFIDYAGLEVNINRVDSTYIPSKRT